MAKSLHPQPNFRKRARVVIQGFGSVGKHAARFLGKTGTVLVAASDSRGTICNPKGIDVARLIGFKDSGKSVMDFPEGEKLAADAVIDIECELWVPAARPDVIRKDNVARLKTKLVPQGANIPFTAEAERLLHKAGALVISRFHRQRRRCHLRLGGIPRRHAVASATNYRRKDLFEHRSGTG